MTEIDHLNRQPFIDLIKSIDEPLIAILSVLIEALNSPLQNGFLE